MFLIRTHMDLARMELEDQLWRMHYYSGKGEGRPRQLVKPTGIFRALDERRKSERKYQEEGKERRLKETKRLIDELRRRGLKIPGAPSALRRAIKQEELERR